MLDAIRLVRTAAPHATLDTCPYDQGNDGIGYFIRIGARGYWLSKVRKTPRAAWANAAQRMRSTSTRNAPSTEE